MSARIVFLNDAWENFALHCGLNGDSPAPGSDYLATCQRIMSAAAARGVASRLRQVLKGLRPRFELDAEGRHDHERFRITASRFERACSVYCIVTHDPIEDSPYIDFEQVFADFSSSFARTSGEEIDNAINRWLARIPMALGLDRSSVARRSSRDGNFYVTHSWSRPYIAAAPIGINATALMPFSAGRVARGETLIVRRPQDVPAEGEQDLVFLRLLGFESGVFIPLKIGDEVVGLVGFASVLRREWSARTIQRMNLIAQVLAGAIERRRVISQLHRLRGEMREMREISKIAMMGEMTASLAHELSQPLGSIMNNAQAIQRLLRTKRPDLEEIQLALEAIVQDDERAVETIRSVRASFQRGSQEHQTLDLRCILLDVERIVRAEAVSLRITLAAEIPETLPSVIGQPTQLIQVTVNLILNAFDSIRYCETGPRKVTLAATHDETGWVRVAVQDTGKGIDPDVLPRLFKSFTTTKANGMGLGLAIARSIIQEHGGKLAARQSEGRGATFEFALPVAKAG